MKRSRSLQLTLMAAALPAALAGCSDEPSGAVLTSPADCRTNQDMAVADCEQAYASAIAANQRLAPRFAYRADCDAQFGSCSPVVEEGTTRWIPPMAGALIGYVALRSTDKDGHASFSSAGSAPVYRDQRSGDFLRPDGSSTGQEAGRVTGTRGMPNAPERAPTVVRGGFGESAAGGHGGVGGEHGGFGGHGGGE